MYQGAWKHALCWRPGVSGSMEACPVFEAWCIREHGSMPSVGGLVYQGAWKHAQCWRPGVSGSMEACPVFEAWCIREHGSMPCV